MASTQSWRRQRAPPRHTGRLEGEPAAHQCPQRGFCGEHVTCGRGVGSLSQVVHGRHPHRHVALGLCLGGQSHKRARRLGELRGRRLRTASNVWPRADLGRQQLRAGFRADEGAKEVARQGAVARVAVRLPLEHAHRGALADRAARDRVDRRRQGARQGGLEALHVRRVADAKPVLDLLGSTGRLSRDTRGRGGVQSATAPGARSPWRRGDAPAPQSQTWTSTRTRSGTRAGAAGSARPPRRGGRSAATAGRGSPGTPDPRRPPRAPAARVR